MEFEIDRSDLKFNVRTMPSLPTSSTAGVENDIAVITSVPMENWILSPDQPTGIPRTDGDVWITYSVEGDTINILNGNTMAIVVLMAYQYVNDEWARIDGRIYKNGAWEDMITEVAIFENGAINADIFGDFYEVDGLRLFSVASGMMHFGHNKSGHSSKLFDVTSFDHIELLIQNYHYVIIDMYLVDESGNSKKLDGSGEWVSGGIRTYDVSSHYGEHYVLFRSSPKIPDDGSNYVTISSVKFKV
jgi:hypothetical protein